MSHKPQLWFHESTVLNFKRHDDSIKLELEDVSTGHIGESKSHVFITCNGIKKIKTDAKESGSNLMAAEDGEVLTLNFTNQTMELIVQWNNFSQHHHFIHAYYIDFDSFQIETNPQKE